MKSKHLPVRGPQKKCPYPPSSPHFFLWALVLLVLFEGVGCTRAALFKSQRWQVIPGNSEPGGTPPPEIQQKLISTGELQIGHETLHFSVQTIEGIKVDGTYVKIISDPKGPNFQSSLLTEKIPKAPQKMDSLTAWLLFLQKNPGYKEWQRSSEIEPFWATKGRLHFVYRCLIFHTREKLYQLDFSPSGEVQALVQVGSRAFGETPQSLMGLLGRVYPTGFKRSELTTVRLSPSPNSSGLTGSLTRVETESQEQITEPKDLLYEPGDLRFDQVQSFFYAERFLLWFQEQFQIGATAPVKIITHVGFPEKTNTAFYFQGVVRLGQGDDQVFSQINWDPSIISHEVSHALIDRIAHLPFQGEGGSLNEGFADTFTTLFLQSPLLGESSYKKSSFKRSVEPSVKLAEKNGGLYHDSAIVSSFFWALQSQVGKDQTLRLAFKVLCRLTPDSQFKDFKEVLGQQAHLLLAPEVFESFAKLASERGLL